MTDKELGYIFPHNFDKLSFREIVKMTEKETKFPYVSKERLKEVVDFFEDFEIPSSDPYQLSPQLEKPSLLREEGFSFSSSSSSTSPSIVPTTPANQK